MKLSKGFFYQFDKQEIQKEVFMTGKYQVTYEYEDNRVLGIMVNVGLDCPQIWEKIDIYNRELYEACEQHLIDIQQET